MMMASRGLADSYIFSKVKAFRIQVFIQKVLIPTLEINHIWNSENIFAGN